MLKFLFQESQYRPILKLGFAKGCETMLKFLFQESQYRPILKLGFAIGVFWIMSNLFEIWIGHPLLNELPSVFIGLTMVFVSGADHIPQQQRTIAIILRGIGVLTCLLALGLWLVRVIRLIPT